MCVFECTRVFGAQDGDSHGREDLRRGFVGREQAPRGLGRMVMCCSHPKEVIVVIIAKTVGSSSAH